MGSTVISISVDQPQENQSLDVYNQSHPLVCFYPVLLSQEPTYMGGKEEGGGGGGGEGGRRTRMGK